MSLFPPPAVTLHDYQRTAVTDIRAAINAGVPLFGTLPTGTGKTVIQKTVLDEEPGGLQIVPSLEIAAGWARLWGIPPDRALLESKGVWTVRKLFNDLAHGRFDPTKVRYLLIDEGHHSTDDTHQGVDAFLGGKPRVGLSATFYRGTPQETEKLAKWWDNRVTVFLSETDAIKRGFASAPECEVWPLVDDEMIDVENGEFKVSAVEAATKNKLQELVQLVGNRFFDREAGLWKRPIMLTLPGVKSVEEAGQWCDHYSLPFVAITGDKLTAGRPVNRQKEFAEVVARKKILVQIKVVGEGVDLPLRVLIDAAPTMSPVFWRQRIGRVMRPVGPGGQAPLYVCTNHNLLRHAYLLRGVLPSAVVVKAREVWGPNFKPSRRMVARASGLAGVGKFVPNEVPLAGGGFLWSFFLAEPTGERHYGCLMSPAGTFDPMWFVRVFEREKDEATGKMMKRYDKRPKWQKLAKAPDLTGCISIPADPWTEPMANWWKKSAASRGFDPEAEVNSRIFQAMPLAFDCGLRFRGMTK